MSARLIAMGLLVCAAIVGVKAWESHLIGKGDARGAARVQADWDTQENARNAERIAHEDAKREAARLARDAAAASVVRGLRDEITRLNQRPNPYPAGDTGIAACTREATTARELFGESSSAYQELASEADQLRDQVVGLQDFAHSVCRAPLPTYESAE